MIKRIIASVLVLTSLAFVGCGNTTSNDKSGENKRTDFKIGIVTPTLSVAEDEFRAGENMKKKYPDMVEHVTLPENFSTEIETAISQITNFANDEAVKAIVVVSGQSGLLPALQKVKEQRPDIITITAPIWDDPELMSQYIDINLDTNWAERGRTIVELAKSMGSKTFIHYSFPTHLAKESVSKRKDMMEATCKALGMEFVEIVTPDPQTGNGPTAMQQFLNEDIPRQIEKYGPETNIFGSNCGMYEVILSKALELKYTVAEQCCPTPTQAYPTVMNLEIEEADITNFDKINDMISEKAKEKGMDGRLGGWPIPASIFLPEYAVELAKYIIDNGKTAGDVLNVEFLNKFAKDTFDVEVDFAPLKEGSKNYFMFIMDQIVY
ncbi:MAG: DUF3798 domain-containing protein [Clostridium sp.]|uniref:DUF3798 domain-containing protein n=1 Tax=Clostridium sp. TaxID=1506 RepID=UPI00304205F8